MKHFYPRFYAFLTGFVSLGWEIVSGKMTEPFFGSGIETWTCILASVLAGFAGGYFLSIFFSKKGSPQKAIFMLLLLAATCLLAIIVLGDHWMESLYLWLGTASLIPIQFLISFPPVFLLAATTPLLIGMEVSESKQSGRSSGTLYAISTLGGVTGLFASGFWIIPQFGLGIWLVMHAFLLAAFSLVWLMVTKIAEWKWLAANSLVLVGVLTAALVEEQPLPADILYRNTGLNGELIVTDLPLEPEYGGGPRRMILNNRIAQTAIHPEANFSLWDYPHYLSSLAGMKPEGADALLLGMAGGSVAIELTQLGFNVDAVDLDPRMEMLGRTYFNLPSQTHVIVDDARHFVNVSNKRYDLVVMDLFSAEGQPEHAFSLEAFQRIRQVLKEDGLLIINYHGFFEGVEGWGTRSVFRTLQAAGMATYFVATRGKPVERNLLLLASPRPLPDPNKVPFRQNTCCNVRLGYIGNMIIPVNAASCADGILLRDDVPALDRFNRFAYRQWRTYAIEHYLLPLRKRGLPYY